MDGGMSTIEQHMYCLHESFLKAVSMSGILSVAQRTAQQHHKGHL